MTTTAPLCTLSKLNRLAAALAAGCTTVVLLLAVVALSDSPRAEQMAQRAVAVPPAGV